MVTPGIHGATLCRVLRASERLVRDCRWSWTIGDFGCRLAVRSEPLTSGYMQHSDSHMDPQATAALI